MVVYFLLLTMEENTVKIDYSPEAYKERLELCIERIAGFPGELKGAAAEYFEAVKLIARLCCGKSAAELHNRAANEALYRELTERGYESSFLNVKYAAERFGRLGTLMSAWYAEFRGIIPFTYEGRIKDVTVILETTVQLYCAFEEHYSESSALDKAADDDMSAHDSGLKAKTKEQDSTGAADATMVSDARWAQEAQEETFSSEFAAELGSIIYSYIYDYADEFVSDYIGREYDPAYTFAKDIVMNADLDNVGDDSYLYAYGEYITEEERGTARLLSTLSEADIERMASAYTEGYIRGFEMTGKDLKLKSTVSLCLPIGFERFMRAAIRKFENAGLACIINRSPVHLINKRHNVNIRPGFYGAVNDINEYAHKEDLALFLGDKLKVKKLEALSRAYETYSPLLRVYSGRACVEIFGKKGESFANSQYRASYTKHQQDVIRDYTFKAHELGQKYMPDEETSFTIIAWPTPSVADGTALYREIFDKIIDINTLPVDKWQDIQQHIIDALDTAQYLEFKGVAGNDTDIRVSLHELKDHAKETNFENCVADVNIPVGEVFTSPRLKGTDGVIHAGYVYICGTLFKDLKIAFKDGRVSAYTCANFEDEAEGRELIEKVIFRDRDRLPMGECAIGTNTFGYAAAKKYGIEDRLPVLIAEKTGPHFAVGDTCYSYEEELVTFNPDGKQIVARENECSALRGSSPKEAYFHVHTDITLPYDELRSVRAVSKDKTIDIIKDGRFVLPGTKELNLPLD